MTDSVRFLSHRNFFDLILNSGLFYAFFSSLHIFPRYFIQF